MCCSRRALPEQIKCLEVPVYQLACVAEPKPAGDHGGADSPEVRRIYQVIACVELSQAWNAVLLPTLHVLPYYGHQVFGAEILSQIDVLRNAAAELREDLDHHVVSSANPFQIFHKC